MKTQSETSRCPLCAQPESVFFFADKKRAYRRCRRCQLVFVPNHYWLNAEKEKAIYDLHENDWENQGYRQFLGRLTIPLLQRLEPQQNGLDFGCGPGPALAKLMAEHGHQMDLYDPFYADNPSVFNKKYDFVTATEVVEHLGDPNRQWTTLFSLLKPDGWLGIMTKMVTDKRAFSRWHYIRDPTHICFYSRPTFLYLASRFAADLFFAEDDVILLQKK